MRDIKFRGKRKDNGQWIYGLLMRKNKKAKAIHYITHGVRIESEYYIQTLKNELGVDLLEEYKVHHESIGEFTGLVDINRKEIYESDIINACGYSIEDEIKAKQVVWAGCSWVDSCNGYVLANTYHSIEVIGNIYENKELLK